jgi:hypothetical protein
MLVQPFFRICGLVIALIPTRATTTYRSVDTLFDLWIPLEWD